MGPSDVASSQICTTRVIFLRCFINHKLIHRCHFFTTVRFCQPSLIGHVSFFQSNTLITMHWSLTRPRIVLRACFVHWYIQIKYKYIIYTDNKRNILFDVGILLDNFILKWFLKLISFFKLTLISHYFYIIFYSIIFINCI